MARVTGIGGELLRDLEAGTAPADDEDGLPGTSLGRW